MFLLACLFILFVYLHPALFRGYSWWDAKNCIHSCIQNPVLIYYTLASINSFWNSNVRKCSCCSLLENKNPDWLLLNWLKGLISLTVFVCRSLNPSSTQGLFLALCSGITDDGAGLSNPDQLSPKKVPYLLYYCSASVLSSAQDHFCSAVLGRPPAARLVPGLTTWKENILIPVLFLWLL